MVQVLAAASEGFLFCDLWRLGHLLPVVPWLFWSLLNYLGFYEDSEYDSWISLGLSRKNKDSERFWRYINLSIIKEPMIIN